MTISNPLLDFAIGMIAFFLTASLIVTALQEVIAQWLDLRAKDLRKQIGAILESGDGPETAKFFDHPLVAALNTRGKEGGPSYIPRDVFTKVVKELYLAGQASAVIADAARGLNDGQPITRALRTMAIQAQGDLEAFDRAVGDWFDGVMDRLSGFYKRRVQWILFVLGLGVAVFGNLDTLKVAEFLANAPAARSSIATEIQSRADELKKGIADDASRVKFESGMKALLDKSGVPMGWNGTGYPSDGPAVFLSVVGWLLTALATTLGAAFWFDTLKRFVNIRAAGPVKQGQA